MITALHLRSDGSYELFEYSPQDSLDILQEKVGGWLELAPIVVHELTMYCNEEGKLLGLPHNKLASHFLGPDNPDWIAGDVVLVGAADKEGYDTGLPEMFVEIIKSTRKENGNA